MGWHSKLAEDLVLVLAVAVVARVVWGLLGPLLPGLALVLIIGSIIVFAMRGPHSRR